MKRFPAFLSRFHSKHVYKEKVSLGILNKNFKVYFVAQLTTEFVPRAKIQNPTHVKWESVQLVPPLSKLLNKYINKLC